MAKLPPAKQIPWDELRRNFIIHPEPGVKDGPLLVYRYRDAFALGDFAGHLTVIPDLSLLPDLLEIEIQVGLRKVLSVPPGEEGRLLVAAVLPHDRPNGPDRPPVTLSDIIPRP